MVALQTDSVWSHIRGYGCFASVGIDLATIPYGYSVSAPVVEKVIRAAIPKGLIKDNDLPTTLPADKWFRVEVQDFNAWVEFVGQYMGKPVKCERLMKMGNKQGKTSKDMSTWLNTDMLTVPTDANAVVLEYDTDGLPGGLSHFVTGNPTSGHIIVDYNPDPKIALKTLVSARIFRVTKG